jgi:mRNA-degrading endonuclease YafQ of YafQ-DinJ toxin-antitoxin module/uncharacterized protein YoxC
VFIPRLAWLTAIAAVSLLALPALAQAPQDVPPGHWAYDAVQELAEKGLIKGYPPTGNFFGKRTVTRYEMATILQRVLARVDDLLAKKADKGETAPTQPTPPTPPAGVTQEQLEEVRKLVDEFKVELTVIGTDMQKVKDELGSLKADIGALKEQVGKHEEEIAGVKQGVQGAIDAINEKGEQINKLSSSKVDAGYGKIKVNGLIQVWIQAEQNAPDKGVVDTFRLRRSEIKLSGNINPKAYWTVMFDPAKNISLNTTSSGGNVTGVSVNQASNVLQDLFLGVTLTPHVALEVGQQKVLLSMEGMRSSSQLLTVDRSIFNTLPTNNGRVGDIRDVAGVVRFTHPLVDAQLGVYDDGGNRQNNTDDNNAKEVMWHAQFKGLRYITLGAYQEISGGVNGLLRTLRHRQGAEFSAAYGPHRLEGEWVQARDAAVSGGVVTNPRVRSHGGYLLYAYRLNPSWEFVGRGEYWNPNRDAHGAAYAREYDLTLGGNWYMTGHNAKIQFNWVRKNIVGPAPGFLGLDRNLFLVNFQESF